MSAGDDTSLEGAARGGTAVEDWYAADPRRRQSVELAYGMGWAAGAPPEWLADLFWTEDTGELFLLRKPVPPEWLPIVSPDDLRRWLAEVQELGAEAVEAALHVLHPRHRRAKTALSWPVPTDEDEADIEPLGVVASRPELEAILAGWSDALLQPDSLGWLRGRLRQFGVALPAPDPPGPPGGSPEQAQT